MSAAPGSGLRRRVLSGLAWKAASQASVQLSRIVVAVVLARLLAPHDYGVAGMVLVVSSLVQVLADLALGAALVQRREISDDDKSTVFWLSVAMGGAFTAAGIALSGPVAAFYHEPELKALFAAFSVSFVVTALGSTHSALLTRSMSFRSLELRQMSAVAVGAVVGIAAALRGYGPWAIIGQQLAITVTSTTLLWAFSSWRPRLVCSVTSLRRLGGFSANVLGTRILFYLNRNLDNLLVGRFLGPAALGAYSISYNVMLAPFSQIAEPVQQVLMPAFSRLQDEPEHLGAIWLRVNKLIGAISVPALLGLVVVAPDFVHVVLGDKWRAATPVIQILSWVGLIQSLQRLNSTILLARDATHTLLRYSVIVLLASVVAFVVGLHWGIVGVAAGYAVSSTIVEPYYTWLTGRTVGVTLRSFLRSLAPVVGAAGAMAAGVAVARALLVSSGIGADARLAILVPLGAVLFVPLYLWREPETLDELRRLRPARGRASTVVAADVTAP